MLYSCTRMAPTVSVKWLTYSACTDEDGRTDAQKVPRRRRWPSLACYRLL